MCLAQWRDSRSKGSSYDLLSAEVARIVKIEEYVHTPEIEQFIEVVTFLDVENGCPWCCGTICTINTRVITSCCETPKPASNSHVETS